MKPSLSPPSTGPVSAHWDHTEQIQSSKYQLFEVWKPALPGHRPPGHLLHNPQDSWATSIRCGSRSPSSRLHTSAISSLSPYLMFDPECSLPPSQGSGQSPIDWAPGGPFLGQSNCWDSLSEGPDEGARSKNQGTWTENYLFVLLFF